MMVYLSFTLTSLPSPALVQRLGTRPALLLASLPYSLYIAHLFFLNSGYIFFTSVLVGVAAPVLWTALGTFLANNSDMRTVNRNAGVFWAIHMASNFIGLSLFLAIKLSFILCLLFFRELLCVPQHPRQRVHQREDAAQPGLRLHLAVGVLHGGDGVAARHAVGRAGPPAAEHRGRAEEHAEAAHQPPDGSARHNHVLHGPAPGQQADTLPVSFHFRDILVIIHQHLQVLWNGVHTTCVGFTMDFGESRKSLAVLGGMFSGLGEVLGKNSLV